MKRLSCRIAEMLASQRRGHLSFHTPGHKRAGADITELSYSDNLLSPSGVLAAAEREIAEILGAARSFLLTDGSTCGVHAILYALKRAGVRRIALSAFSHRSVTEGCGILGLETETIPPVREEGIPLQPTERELAEALERADALLLTSPDYYGNFPPLHFARKLCDAAGKPLVIDGAHGAHLHFSSDYAGRFADLWVDGVHKSLPALTQGAVVSARGPWAERLREGVTAFRTTSPSYPIMASVEYAVKYPRNPAVERAAETLKRELGAVRNADWSKVLILFGEKCAQAQTELERHGIFPEFNDGNYLMFYLSPCTRLRDLRKLRRLVNKLPRGRLTDRTRERAAGDGERVFLPLGEAEGKICAQECGMFPPCLPVFCTGERLTREGIVRLLKAENTYGLDGGRVLVFSKERDDS